MKHHGNRVNGLSKHPLRRAWDDINSRCNNPKVKTYKYYGGKGVKNKFANFEQFFKWAISKGWEPKLQVDRIDGDSHYEPKNCRIVTARVNNQNKKTNKMSLGKAYLVKEMTKTGAFMQKEIASIFGVHRDTIGLITRGKIWL